MAMKPQRKKRLAAILGGVVAIAVVVGLILFASDQQMNLFFTPSEMAAGKAPSDKIIRIGGLVKIGSVKRSETSLLTTFIVTDMASDIPVSYDKIMPDLFREGQGVVALGQLNKEGVFVASNILAKHDEEYKAPEVLDALERAGHPVKEKAKKTKYQQGT